MEYAVTALAVLGVAIIGYAIWSRVRERRAGRAEAQGAQLQADLKAREEYDASLEDWNAGGGLAGGMRDGSE